jgi:hypothetical protein
MSRPGATETPEPIPAAHRGSDPSRVGTDFLPNFCDPRIVLAVVLVAELLALTFSLVRPAGSGFLIDLAQLSVLLQWLGLTSAALLCGLRGRLAGRSAAKTTGAVLAVVLGNILLLSAAIVWAGRRLRARRRPWRRPGRWRRRSPHHSWPRPPVRLRNS